MCLIFLVLLLGIWGCSNSVGPTNDTEQIPKRSISEQPKWLGLPAPKNKSLSKSYTANGTAEENKSVKIEIKDEYEGGIHGLVEFMIKVDIKRGCVKEKVDITMSFSPEEGILTLLPHMVFEKPVEIEYWVKGNNLKPGDEDKIDFVYMNPDGTFESLERKRLTCDVDEGEIKVYEGLTSHFSRFTGLTLE